MSPLAHTCFYKSSIYCALKNAAFKTIISQIIFFKKKQRERRSFKTKIKRKLEQGYGEGPSGSWEKATGNMKMAEGSREKAAGNMKMAEGSRKMAEGDMKNPGSLIP